MTHASAAHQQLRAEPRLSLDILRKHPAKAVMGDRQAAAAGISRSFQFQGSNSCSREAG
jgi:hypothetical protein